LRTLADKLDLDKEIVNLTLANIPNKTNWWAHVICLPAGWGFWALRERLWLKSVNLYIYSKIIIV
jgi:hypothetical protein